MPNDKDDTFRSDNKDDLEKFKVKAATIFVVAQVITASLIKFL